MSNIRSHAPASGLAVALTALGRVARTVLVLALLVATTLLALLLATGWVLRALFTGRRRARGAGPGRRHAGMASTFRARSGPVDVVDVEAREVITAAKHGR